MVGEVRGRCPGLRSVVFLGDPEWEALSTGDRTVLPAIRAGLSFDDPINIQYTSGTTGFPKGATLSHHNILNNGFFVGELCSYTEEDRICIPVPFYHCFGMVMGNLGATSHGACMVIPAEGFDPRATLEAVAAERCTSLYGVPTMFIAELGDPSFGSHDLSSLRTGIMAGSPCPVEVMKRVVADMGMTEVTICYGMTETSPVSTQTRATDDLERRVSTVGQVHPHVEVKIVDPVTGLVVAARDAGRALHPGVLGDARLLGRAGEDGRGARRRRLDAHRRPGRDGRGRLRQHRRADQGHGHPRRRERVPARGRGVPLHPPGHRRRAGDRRPGRAVRRGAGGLGPAPAGRAGADRGRRCGSSAPASSRTTRSRGTSGWWTSSR